MRLRSHMDANRRIRWLRRSTRSVSDRRRPSSLWLSYTAVLPVHIHRFIVTPLDIDISEGFKVYCHTFYCTLHLLNRLDKSNVLHRFDRSKCKWKADRSTQSRQLMALGRPTSNLLSHSGARHACDISSRSLNQIATSPPWLPDFAKIWYRVWPPYSRYTTIFKVKGLKIKVTA